MRTLIPFLLLCVFLATRAGAQEDYSKKPEQKSDEIKTLFRKGEKHKKPVMGYFIGPEFAYTQFTGNKDVFLLGASLGVTFDHWFSVGLSGFGIVNSGHLDYEKLVWDEAEARWQEANLYGGYGGLYLDFIVLPKSPVHISFPILAGIGGLTYLYRPLYVDYYDWGGYRNVDWDVFFVVQPGVRVELNLLKFFRVGIGASYRYAPDLDLINTTASAINQFNAHLSLKFGKF